MNKEIRICPRCGEVYEDFPALSRRDNKTLICPGCGTAEALEDYFGSLEYEGPIYWEVDSEDES